MMLKRSISAPFPKYDSDCEEEERVQKGIIYQYTIGIIYELPTSSSDNPLCFLRPRMSQNSLLAVLPSPFTCVDYGGCYGV